MSEAATLPERPPSAAEGTRDSWVDGARVLGRGGTREVRAPSDAALLATVSLLDAEQCDAAVAGASHAAALWRANDFDSRRRVLIAARRALADRADSIAELIAREQGKPRVEAYTAEILPGLEYLKHLERYGAADLAPEPVESEVVFLAHKQCEILYEPFGVVLVISPWNYPLLIPLTTIAGALLAGNAVVFKPAPATTLIGLEVGRLFSDAGLPPGVLNVVVTDDATAPRLVGHRDVGKVFFTGGTSTARRVMATAAQNLTPVVLELGGKDPAIVCDDADLDRAAAGIAWGAFVNAGQTCVSVERVYVDVKVADAFERTLVEHSRSLRVGDPLDDDTDIGPMTLESQLTLVERHVADAQTKGAKVALGGERTGARYFPPTILTGVDHSMDVMREETFGPLLPVMRVESLDRAVELANDSRYGLTASVWTRDPERARDLQRRLDAGVVTVNDCVYTYGDPSAPFGGVKDSGFGRSHGRLGLREMTQPRFVSRDTQSRPALWWYPYGREFLDMIRVATRALHGSLPTKLLAQLSLLRYRRFWQRLRLRDVIANFDRMF